ncbi:hypothetical protein [Hyphobacterium marinum]|uniref:Peptidase inhibitor I78 family protein n=1 Tax=Hyphobacterium marinum TaxID=3116574 RepID=A0ABU7M071_9PROT|nr:hypothetical protein [Hyphobacterium sp. Y6023]MEE2567198.1 hypothetical protein [Hyphobacterium sp. Y6023]
MSQFKRILAIPAAVAGVVFLAAMSMQTPVLPANGLSEDGFAPTCPAEALQHLVGQPIGEVDLNSMPRPFEVHETGIAPLETSEGGFQTNVEFSADGRVTNVYCG